MVSSLTCNHLYREIETPSKIFNYKRVKNVNRHKFEFLLK